MKAKVLLNGVRIYERGTDRSPIIGSVDRNTILDIEVEYGEWVKLASGGWVKACYTEAVEAGAGGVTSWNDLEDRPFGEESGLVEVLPEITVTGEEGYELFIPNVVDVTAGETYIVTHNGVEYEQVGQAIDMDGTPVVGFGDLSALGGSGNGEPFTMLLFPADVASQMGVGGMVMNTDGSAVAVISIYQNGTVIKPLDPKFLPDGVPYVIDDGERVEVLAECQPAYASENDAFMVTNAPELRVGETYKVLINGVEYVTQSVGWASSDQGSIIILGDAYTASGGEVGNAPTGEPFYIMAEAGGNVFAVKSFEGLTSMTLAIYQGGGIARKMDARCLPELPWLKITYDGESYAANMTYAEAVALMEQGSLLGCSVSDENGNVHAMVYIRPDDSSIVANSYDDKLLTFFENGEIVFSAGR